MKLASAMLEIQMLKICQELRSVDPRLAHSNKELMPRTHVTFDDLSKVMEEF